MLKPCEFNFSWEWLYVWMPDFFWSGTCFTVIEYPEETLVNTLNTTDSCQAEMKKGIYYPLSRINDPELDNSHVIMR